MVDAAKQARVARTLIAQGHASRDVAHVLGVPEPEIAALVVAQEQPLRALAYADRRAHRRDLLPGSLWFTDPGDSAVSTLWFVCPCGCGHVSKVACGVEHRPNIGAPAWRWNGSVTEPTLDPSLRLACCSVHVWLRDGYWERA